MKKFSFPRAALAVGALFAVDMALPETASLFGHAPAEAIVGRPLTPVSVAGVARRTTRRAVVATSAVAAAPVAAQPSTVVVVQSPPPAAPPPPPPQ